MIVIAALSFCLGKELDDSIPSFYSWTATLRFPMHRVLLLLITTRLSVLSLTSSCWRRFDSTTGMLLGVCSQGPYDAPVRDGISILILRIMFVALARLSMRLTMSSSETHPHVANNFPNMLHTDNVYYITENDDIFFFAAVTSMSIPFE